MVRCKYKLYLSIDRTFVPELKVTLIPILLEALPNSLHFEWSKKALLAGKHVLLEKPCTNNATEARGLAALVGF